MSASDAETPENKVRELLTEPTWQEKETLCALFEKNWHLVPKCPGAYLIATGEELRRAVSSDPLGVIDIGRSVNLRDRIKKFWLCATGSYEIGHMAGWRYRDLNMKAYFPLEKLSVRWCRAATKEDAAILEGHALAQYLAKHMELPPLNYAASWKHLDAS